MTSNTGVPDTPMGVLPHLEEWENEDMAGYAFPEVQQAYRTLERHFTGQVVFVASEVPVRYDRTDRRRAVLPDLMVIRRVPPRIRDDYIPWREGEPPHWVLELASESTAERDRDVKPVIYRQLGVEELVLFDPAGEYHDAVLTLLVLTEKGYSRAEPNASGRLVSRVLGLEMAAVDYRSDNVRYWTLRFYEPGASEPIPTDQELIQRQDRRIAELEKRLSELGGAGKS